jgi:NAD(P)-dependent dehydrogenase (short-subunit alcohol dehydrogenase family)
MSFTTRSIPELSGTTSVITGANSGLGFATAKALASHGSHIVMAARNLDKARAAASLITRDVPAASLEIVELDLGSLESVEQAAGNVMSNHERIDILINNAGLMAMPEGRTSDGFETQFGVNHLGHWALTARLLPALVDAPAARVVTVTSSAHHFGRGVDPANPNLEGSYSPWKAYGHSKLANYHFAIGLQSYFETNSLPVASFLAHPGLSDTNLQTRTVEEGGGGFVGWLSLNLARRTGMSAERGALCQIRAATDPRARGGQFYAPRYFTFGPPVVRPMLRPGRSRAISNLWAVSEHATGLPMKV